MWNKNDKEKINKALGRSDPFEFWLKEAEVHCRKLGLGDRPTVEALSMVRNAFGQDWVKNNVIEPKSISLPFSDRHPVAGWIFTPGARQVCSLLELANYLREMHSVPKLNEVVNMMKIERQFQSAFNQLAFGYRFLKLGATGLEFEPLTDGGRSSDILFKYENDYFIVESYVPEANSTMWYQDLLEVSVKRVQALSEKLKRRVSVFLTVKNEPKWDPQHRKDAEALIAEFMEKSSDTYFEKSTQNFNLQIYDTTTFSEREEQDLYSKLFSKSTCGVNIGMMNVNDSIKIMRGEKTPPSVPIGRFLINVVEETPSRDKILENLARKVEQKITQLRREDLNPKGILLVGTHHGSVDSSSKIKKLNRIRGKIIDGHENIAGVLMVQRVQDEDACPFYSGVFLGEVQNRLFDQLIELEWKKDFMIR